MALVFADQLSKATSGERRTLDTFQKAFVGEADSIIWLEPTVIERDRTDLLLWWPCFGLVLIEVKDWSADAILEASPKTWKIVFNSRIQAKENPALQAWNSLTALMNRLKRVPELCHRDGDYEGGLLFPIIHFVAFPNMTSSDFYDCPCKLKETMAQDCGVLFREEVDFDCSTKEQAEAFRAMLRRRGKRLFESKLPTEAVTFLQQAIRPVYRRPDPPPRPVVTEEPFRAPQRAEWRTVAAAWAMPRPRRRFRRVLTAREWAVCLLLIVSCSFAAKDWVDRISRGASANSVPRLSLTATPDKVRPGHPVKLRWVSSGYRRVTLDRRDVDPNGEETVTPWSTTRHFLMGFPDNGEVESTVVTVEVGRSNTKAP